MATSEMLHHTKDQSNTSADRLDLGVTPEDEQVLKTIHPAVIRRFVVTVPLAMVLAPAGLIFAIVVAVNGNAAQAVAGVTVAAVAGIYLGIRWLQSLYTTLTITSKRTILRLGIISKQTSEVQHSDVRNIQVDQNIIERLLGVGDLAVSSAGQDTLEVDADGIADPDEIAAMVRERQ